MAEELIIDPWSYYDYKPTFPETRGIKGNLHPTWVGDNFRRLSAYNLLEAYYRNGSRDWLDVATVSQDDIDKRREYGDPFVVVQQMVASVLGEEQNLVVDGAESTTPIADAVQQKEILQKWNTDERVLLKMIECERNAQKLGDGVYVLHWDDDDTRPHLRVYNPGVYFPVLDDADPNGWPTKIHLAWEFEKLVEGQPRKYVTRSTWELADLDGNKTQSLPWNDDPTDQTCYFSKGTWELGDIKVKDDPDLFDPAKASWDVGPDKDLGIDYIPVIHVPNTVAEEEHFGTSIFANVMQIFDDIISVDTDLQASAATTGSPPIAVAGANLPVDADGKIAGYGPGTVWQTGDGSATMIDTSTSLDALLKMSDALLKRMSINTRIPESLLGRIKPSEVPSGITLALSFTPHTSTVREMRLVRREKYSLLYKFVSRWYMKKGELDELFTTELHFGSFLPSHKKEIVDLVVQCMNTKPPVISLETSVRMLVEAGFPIDDAVQEIQRIIQNDYETAGKMLDVVGEPNPVRARLGLPPLPEPPVLPEPDFGEPTEEDFLP